MIKIGQFEMDLLRKAKLIRDKGPKWLTFVSKDDFGNNLKDKDNNDITYTKKVIVEANYVVVNKEHMSRSKTYFVVEEGRILSFLEKLDNLQIPQNRDYISNIIKKK